MFTCLTSNMSIVGCKWIFKTKLKVNGTINQYKAHMVLKGYSQVVKIDYQFKLSHH
jgi:hypothetical protein